MVRTKVWKLCDESLDGQKPSMWWKMHAMMIFENEKQTDGELRGRVWACAVEQWIRTSSKSIDS